MTATLLGAEHDLCAVLAVGVFVATVGVLGRRACAAVLLCPELEVAFGTQEVQAVVESAIATLVTADVVVCTAEHDDGDRTVRIALCAVGLVQVHMDDKAISDEVSVPQTADNSWDTYKTITVKEGVKLSAGKHVLKLEITANYVNLDWIQFTDAKETIGLSKVRLDMTEAESRYPHAKCME